MATKMDESIVSLKAWIEYLRESNPTTTRGGKKRPATLMQIEEMLGVSHTTVGDLSRGHPSSRDQMRKIADKIGMSRCRLLTIAGYLPFREDMDHDREKGYVDEVVRIERLTEKMGHLLDFDSRSPVRPIRALTSTEEREEAADLKFQDAFPGSGIYVQDQDLPSPDLLIRKGDAMIIDPSDEPMEQQFGSLLLFLVDEDLWCNRLLAIDERGYRFMPIGREAKGEAVPRDRVRLIGRVSGIIHRC